MNETELIELVRNGENSGVEFKSDTVANHDVAKEIVALLNLEGGSVLLGVEDDGKITVQHGKTWRSGWRNYASLRLIRR